MSFSPAHLVDIASDIQRLGNDKGPTIDLDTKIEFAPGSTQDTAHDIGRLLTKNLVESPAQNGELISYFQSRESKSLPYNTPDIIQAVLEDLNTVGDLLHIYDAYLEGRISGEYKVVFEYNQPPRKDLSAPHFVFTFDEKTETLVIHSPIIENGKTAIKIGRIHADKKEFVKDGKGFGIVIEPDTITDERKGLIVEGAFVDSQQLALGSVNYQFFYGKEKKSYNIRPTKY